MKLVAIGGPYDGQAIDLSTERPRVELLDGGAYVYIRFSERVAAAQYIPKGRPRWEKARKHVDWPLHSPAATR